MVRGWTMVCAAMILAGQQLSAWLLAGDTSAESVSAAAFEQAAPDNSKTGTYARCSLLQKVNLVSSLSGIAPID